MLPYKFASWTKTCENQQYISLGVPVLVKKAPFIISLLQKTNANAFLVFIFILFQNATSYIGETNAICARWLMIGHVVVT